MQDWGVYLTVTTVNNVYIYNEQMSLIRQINSNQIPQNGLLFSCATLINDILYLGTKENGLYSTTLTSSTVFNNLTPAGPTQCCFALQTTPLHYGPFSVITTLQSL
jgi:hypothetical protein